ncbi:MAG: DUF3040 domain-containing protein [Acidimicrobiales bacterium]
MATAFPLRRENVIPAVVELCLSWETDGSVINRGVSAVPLSEDEQRILSEIEQQLYQSDPGLARDIADTTVYTAASRGMKWSAFGFIVGLVAMVLTIGIGEIPVFAFGGFLVMLICALAFERNGRKLGKAGMQQMTQSVKATGFRDALDNTRSRLKDRMQREDEN